MGAAWRDAALMRTTGNGRMSPLTATGAVPGANGAPGGVGG